MKYFFQITIANKDGSPIIHRDGTITCRFYASKLDIYKEILKECFKIVGRPDDFFVLSYVLMKN